MSTVIDHEVLLAASVQFLLQGNDLDAARLLLSCTVENIHATGQQWDAKEYIHIHLRGSRMVYDAFHQDEHSQYFKPELAELASSIQSSLAAVLPHMYLLDRTEVRSDLLSVEPGWQIDMRERARGSKVHNQAKGATDIVQWNNFYFRSQTEKRIAEAFDRTGVLFLPLPKARLSGPNSRLNVEPDFLVCSSGNWGILEVDGDEFHPPSRAAHDHERDRLFRHYGVRVVEHYDAARCYRDSVGVVRDFLNLLERSSQ